MSDDYSTVLVVIDKTTHSDVSWVTFAKFAEINLLLGHRISGTARLGRRLTAAKPLERTAMGRSTLSPELARTDMARTWPFTGRREVAARLRHSLLGHETSCVVLVGPAGVGKTRLALEVVKTLRSEGFAVRHAIATLSSQSLPFGALASLLPAGPVQLPRRGSSAVGMLQQTLSSLTRSLNGERLLLLVDDAHVLDDYSATLIAQIAVSGAASVILTVRAGEPTPDAIVALWKNGNASRLDLPRPSAGEIGELLKRVLGRPLDPAAARTLCDRCQGNLLFLREIVFGAVASGSLREVAGIWMIVDELEPSDRLVDLIEARLAGLSHEERAVLEIVAVGEPLRVRELERLADVSIASSLETKALLSASRHGPDVEIRLDHPLYGDVLRARMPSLRIRSVSRAVADAIEESGPVLDQSDLLRVATHRLDGGGGRPDLMLEAARIARWNYDFNCAKRLAEAAYRSGGGFDARLLLAEIANLQGQVHAAEEQLEELAQLAATDEQRKAVALARLDGLGFHAGQVRKCLEIAKEAEATIQSPAARSEVVARRIALVGGAQGPRAAVALVDDIMASATGRNLIWACIPGAFLYARMGRFAESLEATERGESLRTTQASHDWYPWSHLFDRAMALTEMGQPRQAAQIARQQYDSAIAVGSAEAQAHFAWQLSKIAIARGRISVAIRLAREAVSLFQLLGRPRFKQFCLETLAVACGQAGDAKGAAGAVEAIDELDLEESFFTGTDSWEARAWAVVAHGDLASAADILSRGAAIACDIGDLVAEGRLLHGLVRIGRARQAIERLRALASVIEGPLIQSRFNHADATVKRDPRLLLAACDEFESIGADLLAAEAASDAAVAYRKSGCKREAAFAVRRAAKILEACGGAATPALLTLASRSTLTQAEREVAILAMSGRPNKAIAADLHISVRTVENELHRVYVKLGIAGRSELREALGATAELD
jgi:DNA-binding CsgD family transcriptional regulator